jgi:hypothetical protein
MKKKKKKTRTKGEEKTIHEIRRIVNTKEEE